MSSSNTTMHALFAKVSCTNGNVFIVNERTSS